MIAAASLGSHSEMATQFHRWPTSGSTPGHRCSQSSIFGGPTFKAMNKCGSPGLVLYLSLREHLYTIWTIEELSHGHLPVVNAKDPEEPPALIAINHC